MILIIRHSREGKTGDAKKIVGGGGRKVRECGIDMFTLLCLKWKTRDFPGGPVGNTLPSKAGSAGLIPGQAAKIPHAP